VNFYFGMLNRPDAPIWNNRQLREAVAIGVNWDEIGQVTFGDMYIKAYSIAPQASQDFVDVGWGDLEYNPEKAKQMLAELGYGPDNPLKLYSFMMNSVVWKTICEALQFQLSQLGIVLDLEFGDTPTAMDAWAQYDTVDVGFHWSHRGSPAFELRMSVQYMGSNTGQKFTYIDDEIAQEIFGRLVHTRDDAGRHEAAVELQEYLHDEYLIVPVCEMASSMGFRSDKFTPQQMDDYIVSAVSIYQLSRLGLLAAWQ
jgi:ABC-type transport system substrate-binding protein